MVSIELLQFMEENSSNYSDVMDEHLKEVQSCFPDDNITKSMLSTLHQAVQYDHPKLFVATLNDIKNTELINYLVNMQFNEYDGQSVTPLTLAAMRGNTTFVKTLLSHYEIDLERESNVIFDGLVVYGATALWVAAGMGHLQVVKLLVQGGADVNHNTFAQSSPLRAACYVGRVDIVKYLIDHGADVNLANTYNNTCIMIAAYKGHTYAVALLLENGADPNCQALCGATALHYAAECGHLEVCTLLLQHGAVLKLNEHQLTPVLQAAERTHEEVVQMFINCPGLMTKEEIINAIELLGASFANDKDNYNVSKAYMYLLKAMEMRYSDPNNIIRKSIMAPVPAYDNWFETENMLELQAIRLNHHSIHMEALTIRERILGKHNPELVQPIIYRGAVMADQARFTQCQTLWNYAMELRMINNLSIDRDLLRFAQLFSQIIRMENQTLCMKTVLSVLTKCQQEIENNKYKMQHPGPKDVPRLILEHNNQNILTAIYLIQILAKIRQVNIKEHEIEELYAIILRFIRCDTRWSDGQTLLHVAVNAFTSIDEYRFDTYQFPCFRTALLLVHAGASVTTVDTERNTPMHTLIGSLKNSTIDTAQAEKIVKLFVEAGAHLDAVNEDGLTPAQLCVHPTITSLLLSYQNANTTLKCIAARSIAVNRINYEGLVPKVLESFIETHSAKKPCT